MQFGSPCGASAFLAFVCGIARTLRLSGWTVWESEMPVTVFNSKPCWMPKNLQLVLLRSCLRFRYPVRCPLGTNRHFRFNLNPSRSLYDFKCDEVFEVCHFCHLCPSRMRITSFWFIEHTVFKWPHNWHPVVKKKTSWSLSLCKVTVGSPHPHLGDRNWHIAPYVRVHAFTQVSDPLRHGLLSWFYAFRREWK